MDFKLSGIVYITIGIVTSQIYFPTEELEETLKLSSRNTRPVLYLRNSTVINVDDLLAHTVTQITLDVNRVRAANSQDNVVFSPISVTGVITLLLLGSMGQTFNEIKNFMHFNNAFNIENDILEVHRQLGRISSNIMHYSGSNNVVLYKTAIFVQEDYPIRKEYQQAVDHFYNGNVINLNFLNNPDFAKTYINNWVSESTKGTIPTLLTEIPNPSTKAIVVNALYFKGLWEYPFIKGGSAWKPFYVNGRRSKSDRMAMMMYNGGDFPYYKDKDLDVEIMGFPYKDSSNIMYVILPHNSSVNKLRELEYYLTTKDIDRLISSTTIHEANVAFPKMKLSSTTDFAHTLKTLGVKSLFDSSKANLALLTPGITTRFAEIPHRPTTSTQQPQPSLGNQLIFSQSNEQSNCQRVYDYYTSTIRCNQVRRGRASRYDFLDTLQNISKQYKDRPEVINPGLYADQFIHKVLIDITEEGTEAAAVSGIGINRSGGKLTFRCDVPFLFFIYQKDTKMILFWGSIKSPEPSVPNNV